MQIVLSIFLLTLQILYSDSFRKQVQGRASYVLDTPEMRRVRESQRNISTVMATDVMSSFLISVPEGVTI